MAENEEKELTLKGLAIIFATALVSSGSTLGVKQYIDPPTDAVNRQVLETVKGLSIAVAKLSTEPKSRPDPWTGTMARESHARIQKQFEEVREHDAETDRRVQGLRDVVAELSSTMRAISASVSAETKRLDRVEAAISKHTSGTSGRINRLQELERRMKRLEDR